MLTLPAASSFDDAQGLVIVDESGACSPSISIEIAASGSDTIITGGGVKSVFLTQAGQKLFFRPTGAGTGWTYGTS